MSIIFIIITVKIYYNELEGPTIFARYSQFLLLTIFTVHRYALLIHLGYTMQRIECIYGVEKAK